MAQRMPAAIPVAQRGHTPLPWAACTKNGQCDLLKVSFFPCYVKRVTIPPLAVATTPRQPSVVAA